MSRFAILTPDGAIYITPETEAVVEVGYTPGAHHVVELNYRDADGYPRSVDLARDLDYAEAKRVERAVFDEIERQAKEKRPVITLNMPGIAHKGQDDEADAKCLLTLAARVGRKDALLGRILVAAHELIGVDERGRRLVLVDIFQALAKELGYEVWPRQPQLEKGGEK